jgi:hypothetical protein
MSRDDSLRGLDAWITREEDWKEFEVEQNEAEMECAIARALIACGLKRGWSIDVFDGEAFTVRKSRDAEAIFKALATTDQDVLRFHDGDERVGNVLLIWGNGCDLISDNSDYPAINELIDEAKP